MVIHDIAEARRLSVAIQDELKLLKAKNGGRWGQHLGAFIESQQMLIDWLLAQVENAAKDKHEA